MWNKTLSASNGRLPGGKVRLSSEFQNIIEKKKILPFYDGE